MVLQKRWIKMINQTPPQKKTTKYLEWKKYYYISHRYLKDLNKGILWTVLKNDSSDEMDQFLRKPQIIKNNSRWNILGVGKLWSAGHIKYTACFCTVYQLRTVFTFLNGRG